MERKTQDGDTKRQEGSEATSDMKMTRTCHERVMNGTKKKDPKVTKGDLLETGMRHETDKKAP